MLNLLFYNHLYNWYESNHRVLPWRETEDGYAIWLSEIILQQTRVAQGLDYYMRFIHRWPTVEALAAADEGKAQRRGQQHSRHPFVHPHVVLLHHFLKITSLENT